MVYVEKYDHDASYFEPWGGAFTRWYALDGAAKDMVYEFLEKYAARACEDGHPLTASDINYWIWFECEDWLVKQGLNLDGTLIDYEETE